MDGSVASAEEPDGSLWARVRAGDGHAFEVLYDRHVDRLHAYLYRRTASTELAQDLNSLVWLDAWRLRSRVETQADGGLAPWLFGVANNVLRNQQRTARRHERAMAQLPRHMNEPDLADEVTDRLDEQRRLSHVLQEIDRLPARERDVLTLSIWAELDHNQVAAALGIRVGTVKSRLSRARARLRQSDDPQRAEASTARLPFHAPQTPAEAPS